MAKQTEHLSSAARDLRPTLLAGEDGTLQEVDSEATDAFHRQGLGRTELTFEDFDPAHDRDSARMTAAAKLEEALLDLDERGAGAEEKAEVEAALEMVATIEPDKEANLSRIGVIGKKIERLKGWVRTFEASGDKRLATAVSQLNSAQLALDALTAAEDEQTAINNQVTGEAAYEDYDVAQVHARKAMADARNGLVQRNRHRRNGLRQAA